MPKQSFVFPDLSFGTGKPPQKGGFWILPFFAFTLLLTSLFFFSSDSASRGELYRLVGSAVENIKESEAVSVFLGLDNSGKEESTGKDTVRELAEAYIADCENR